MEQPTSLGTDILATCRNAARQLTGRQSQPDPRRAELQQAYLEVLESGPAHHAAAQADRLFSLVTSLTPADQPALRRFLNGWGDTHVSSNLVTVLALRLYREDMGEAAGHMMEVIADDIGKTGKPHAEMFATFANALCVPAESWREARNKTESCVNFRDYLREMRHDAPFDEAILTTAASEIWNVGEYTQLTYLMQEWMENKMGLSRGQAASANAYVRVHGGDTELNHFLHAIEAWEIQSERAGVVPLVETAASCMEIYLQKLGNVYSGLADAIEHHRRPALQRYFEGAMNLVI
jgi:hypothetical protein